MRVGEARGAARALLLLRLRSRRVIASRRRLCSRPLSTPDTRSVWAPYTASRSPSFGPRRCDRRRPWGFAGRWRGGARRPGPRRRTQWARSRIRRRARRRARRRTRGPRRTQGGREARVQRQWARRRARGWGRGRGRGRAPRLWQRHRARGGSEPGGRVDERWGSRASKGPRGQARGAGRQRRCEARTREPGTPSDTGGRAVRSVHHRTTAVSQRHGVPTQRSDALDPSPAEIRRLTVCPCGYSSARRIPLDGPARRSRRATTAVEGPRRAPAP